MFPQVAQAQEQTAISGLSALFNGFDLPDPFKSSDGITMSTMSAVHYS